MQVSGLATSLSAVVILDYPDLTDEELMARLSYRDIKAFETLYDRYGKLVYSTALRVMADVHLAEDIAQEVFLRLWRRPEHYVPQRGRFATWLVSVARNRAVDQVRTRGRRRKHEVTAEVPEQTLPGSDTTTRPWQPSSAPTPSWWHQTWPLASWETRFPDDRPCWLDARSRRGPPCP